MLLISFAPASEVALQASGYWSIARITAVTDTSITVSWDKASSANKYQLYYGKSNSSENRIIINNKNTTSYTITGLQKGVTYRIQVDMIDNSGHWWGNCISATTCTPAPPPPPVPVCYPITVKYYKDCISDANYLGCAALPSAVVGTPINNVNLSLFAPSGYTTPGTRSGDTVVAARQNIVYVVYTRPQLQKRAVYVLYVKDSLEGTVLGIDCIETVLPAGSPVTLLGIDRTKYAPDAGAYFVPGDLIGDSVIGQDCTIVIVLYRLKPRLL
jgi:hypothetical protein